jgi:hypothetical protein
MNYLEEVFAILHKARTMEEHKKVSQKEISAVLELPGPKRYKHFVKTVVDWEEAWGLYQDGWALAGTGDGKTVFPLWPAKEYAELCAKDEWEGHEPTPIPLEELTDQLLPQLKQDDIIPGIFYTPNDKGVLPPVDKLLQDLEDESQNYE